MAIPCKASTFSTTWAMLNLAMTNVVKDQGFTREVLTMLN